MTVRLRFACEYCSVRPDPATERSLRSQVLQPGSTPYLDALPGRWLVWRGGGALGPRRYACAEHRGELTAYLRLHYASINSCVWQRPPYPRVQPADACRVPRPTRPARTTVAASTAGAPAATSSFLTLAREPRPRLDDLLLAMAAEFRPVDMTHARDLLDDFSRSLFGLASLDAGGQAGCVSHAMRHELGLRHGDLQDPEELFLDRVLERRRGHPLLLASVAVELARRAGAPATVCSAPTRLFTGFGRTMPRLVEFTRPAGATPAPDTVRRHCAHAVAFGILGGLHDSYARTPGRESEAQHASALQRALRGEHVASQPST
ncbi:MAG: transglutaminase family protein [Solirubrobacteraceae bacterium]|nr:transglutaminase family protein [Solirubrobacteraceae bacterium]